MTREAYHAAVAKSFMLSADNAHALHPNHPEKADPANRPLMNHGIVIKYHAGQKYDRRRHPLPPCSSSSARTQVSRSRSS